MAGRVQTGRQGEDPLRLQLRDGGELHQGLPLHAEPGRHPRHQPQQPGDCGRGLCGAPLRQEDQVQGIKKNNFCASLKNIFYLKTNKQNFRILLFVTSNFVLYFLLFNILLQSQ